jgi:uncharacterized ion transporter superfamily protein YfcC
MKVLVGRILPIFFYFKVNLLQYFSLIHIFNYTSVIKNERRRRKTKKQKKEKQKNKEQKKKTQNHVTNLI